MSSHQFQCKERVARKEYKCDWDGEPILKGEKYLRTEAIDGDKFVSGFYHLECVAMPAKAGLTVDDDVQLYTHKRGSIEENGR